MNKQLKSPRLIILVMILSLMSVLVQVVVMINMYNP